MPAGEVVGGGKACQVPDDLRLDGFDDVFLTDLFRIAGEVGFRQAFFGQIPAGPGTPGAQFFMRLDHACGEVLPVAARVADELILGPI